MAQSGTLITKGSHTPHATARAFRRLAVLKHFPKKNTSRRCSVKFSSSAGYPNSWLYKGAHLHMAERRALKFDLTLVQKAGCNRIIVNSDNME